MISGCAFKWRDMGERAAFSKCLGLNSSALSASPTDPPDRFQIRFVVLFPKKRLVFNMNIVEICKSRDRPKMGQILYAFERQFFYRIRGDMAQIFTTA